MENIKDYLRFHMGCPLIYKVCGDECYDTFQVESKQLTTTLHPDAYTKIMQGRFDWPYKIALRPLSDITEDEMFYCIETFGLAGPSNMKPSDWIIGWNAFQPECFRYLLSKNFDLFGLIHAGLAIDSTKEVVNENN